jgi:hypothetical protein
MSRYKLSSLVMLVFLFGEESYGQTPKWYKFNKAFINHNVGQDSALGQLDSSQAFPASRPHSISCGGEDGELHVGIPGKAILGPTGPLLVSAPGNESDRNFGIVAEPANASASLVNFFKSNQGENVSFFGYYRVWNEGHDVGAVHPSNPHHVLELHPAWAIKVGDRTVVKPGSIFAMPEYQGYGISKYGPLLTSISARKWLEVAEDQNYVYVQLIKAENFYQLPVTVKGIHPIQKGVEAIVDVYSDFSRSRLVYPDLRVIAIEGTRIATQLASGQKAYLLGIFSVNLRRAMAAASGHEGLDAAVYAPDTLEFFTFGIPQKPPVSSSADCKD